MHVRVLAQFKRRRWGRRAYGLLSLCLILISCGNLSEVSTQSAASPTDAAQRIRSVDLPVDYRLTRAQLPWHAYPGVDARNMLFDQYDELYTSERSGKVGSILILQYEQSVSVDQTWNALANEMTYYGPRAVIRSLGEKAYVNEHGILFQRCNTIVYVELPVMDYARQLAEDLDGQLQADICTQLN